MSDNIGNFLDTNGRATMTGELYQLFCANGCMPACHACSKSIAVGRKFRIKEFHRTKVEDRDVIASAMICGTCDRRNTKLPYEEAKRLAKSAGIDSWQIPTQGTVEIMKEDRRYPIFGGCFLVNGKIVT